MADVRDIFYHGIRQQIRRVLDAMGDERIDKGLTAFEDGASNWQHCFFARAFKGELDLMAGNPEYQLAKALGFGTNRVPVRIVYNIFDGNGLDMTKDELKQFITAVRDESRPEEVLQLLKSLDMDKVTETPIPERIFCA